MRTMNLLKETIECISLSGHNTSDITFIGSEESGHCCSWDEFTVLANEDYDSGFGASQVAEDLIIVFNDGQKMWRGEYDGSEWWELSVPFTSPLEFKPISKLITNKVGWDTLKEINEEKTS